MSRLETWKEAIQQLGVAVGQLDQAHATLKDLGMENVGDHDAQAYGSVMTLKSVRRHADEILKAAKTADCDECGHAISMHEDKYGCQYERGDEGKPCTCQWWAQPVRKGD
jgi:hypothetical protein